MPVRTPAPVTRSILEVIGSPEQSVPELPEALLESIAAEPVPPEVASVNREAGYHAAWQPEALLRAVWQLEAAHEPPEAAFAPSEAVPEWLEIGHRGWQYLQPADSLEVCLLDTVAELPSAAPRALSLGALYRQGDNSLVVHSQMFAV